MNLCITCHVRFHKVGADYCSTPGFIKLMEMVAPLCESVDLCVPVFEEAPTRGATPLKVPNIHVRPLPPYYSRFEITAFSHPVALLKCLWGPIRDSDAVWVLTPNYLSLLVWAACLAQGKAFAVRLAGNWPEILRMQFAKQGLGLVGWLAAAAADLLFRAMTRTAAVTYAHGRDLSRHYGRSNPRVRCVVSSTVHEADIADRPAGSAGPERRVLYAGVLHPSKGLLELFTAVRRLLDDGLPVRLVVAGSAWDQDLAMQARVEELGMTGAVEFLGWVPYEDMSRLYRSSDVLAMPSHSETGPKVVSEAMANGLPVVATRVGSVPIVVSQGVTGLIVPVGNADELYKALRQVLGDEGLRQRMAQSALQRAGLFTMEAERRIVAEGFRDAGFPLGGKRERRRR